MKAASMFYCCFHFEKFYLSAAANHHKFMMPSRFKGPEGPRASIALDNLKMSSLSNTVFAVLLVLVSMVSAHCVLLCRIASCNLRLQGEGEVECGWGVEWVGYRLL